MSAFIDFATGIAVGERLPADLKTVVGADSLFETEAELLAACEAGAPIAVTSGTRYYFKDVGDSNHGRWKRVYYDSDSGDWETEFVDNHKVFSGEGTPDNDLGYIGDFYIDYQNLIYYEKTGASTWTKRFDIADGGGYQVDAASTGNINLGLVPATIDDVTLEDGQSYLLKDQTDPVFNGIYVYRDSPSSLLRHPSFGVDATGLSDIHLHSTLIYVRRGTVNEGKTYRCTNETAPEIGTDNINYDTDDFISGGTLKKQDDGEGLGEKLKVQNFPFQLSKVGISGGEDVDNPTSDTYNIDLSNGNVFYVTKDTDTNPVTIGSAHDTSALTKYKFTSFVFIFENTRGTGSINLIFNGDNSGRFKGIDGDTVNVGPEEAIMYVGMVINNYYYGDIGPAYQNLLS